MALFSKGKEVFGCPMDGEVRPLVKHRTGHSRRTPWRWGGYFSIGR